MPDWSPSSSVGSPTVLTESESRGFWSLSMRFKRDLAARVDGQLGPGAPSLSTTVSRSTFASRFRSSTAAPAARTAANPATTAPRAPRRRRVSRPRRPFPARVDPGVRPVVPARASPSSLPEDPGEGGSRDAVRLVVRVYQVPRGRNGRHWPASTSRLTAPSPAAFIHGLRDRHRKATRPPPGIDPTLRKVHPCRGRLST